MGETRGGALIGPSAGLENTPGKSKMPSSHVASSPENVWGEFSTARFPTPHLDEPSYRDLERGPRAPSCRDRTGGGALLRPTLWVELSVCRGLGVVYSLRCSANTGSKKLIRVLSISRFLPTPILITQLCS